MTKIDNDLEMFEVTIDEAKERVNMMETVLRLTKNKDYIKVMDIGYFQEEAARLVLLKAEDSLSSDNDRRRLEESITAIAHTYMYLRTLVQLGRLAEKGIAEAETEREYMLTHEEESDD